MYNPPLTQQTIHDYLMRSPSSLGDWLDTHMTYANALSTKMWGWICEDDVGMESRFPLTDRNGFFQSVYHWKNPIIAEAVTA